MSFVFLLFLSMWLDVVHSCILLSTTCIEDSSLVEIDSQKVQSSAYLHTRTWFGRLAGMASGMSSINKLNNGSEITDPCGTPDGQNLFVERALGSLNSLVVFRLSGNSGSITMD